MKRNIQIWSTQSTLSFSIFYYCFPTRDEEFTAQGLAQKTHGSHLSVFVFLREPFGSVDDTQACLRDQGGGCAGKTALVVSGCTCVSVSLLLSVIRLRWRHPPLWMSPTALPGRRRHPVNSLDVCLTTARAQNKRQTRRPGSKKKDELRNRTGRKTPATSYAGIRKDLFGKSHIRI